MGSLCWWCYRGSLSSPLVTDDDAFTKIVQAVNATVYDHHVSFRDIANDLRCLRHHECVANDHAVTDDDAVTNHHTISENLAIADHYSQKIFHANEQCATAQDETVADDHAVTD